jgi:hypothetical protein
VSQSEPVEFASLTYTNPVYPSYFADPFVWEYQGTYYAIGTGAAEAEGEVNEAVEQPSRLAGSGASYAAP